MSQDPKQSWFKRFFQSEDSSFDPVLDEIRRDDWLRRLRQAVPLMIISSVVIVTAALVYGGWQYSKEKSLHTAEKLYREAVNALQKGDLKEAMEKFKRVQDRPELAFLTSLYVGFLSDHQKNREKVRENYTKIKENYNHIQDRFFKSARYHGPFYGFSTLVLGYLSLFPGIEDQALEKTSAFFLQSKEGFKGLALGRKALKMWISKDQSAGKAFIEWQQYDQATWLATACSMGAGVSLVKNTGRVHP